MDFSGFGHIVRQFLVFRIICSLGFFVPIEKKKSVNSMGNVINFRSCGAHVHTCPSVGRIL